VRIGRKLDVAVRLVPSHIGEKSRYGWLVSGPMVQWFPAVVIFRVLSDVRGQEHDLYVGKAEKTLIHVVHTALASPSPLEHPRFSNRRPHSTISCSEVTARLNDEEL
jgi:hypothetical protein